MTINLEQDLAKRLDDLIAMNSANCPQPRKRDLHSLQKRVDITPELAACLTAGMVIVIRNIYNGALGQLARLRQEGRVAARPPQAGALVCLVLHICQPLFCWSQGLQILIPPSLTLFLV